MAAIARHVARVAVGLALVLALDPEPAPAQGTTTLKVQAAWPGTSMIWENSKFFAERVGKLSGGRLKIEMLASGAVVPPFESLDATARGVLDGAHAAPAYWVGKNKAAALFGPAPGGPFGMDMLDYLGWLYQGGGLELYREFYRDVLKSDVVPLPLTAVSNQVLGCPQEVAGAAGPAGVDHRVRQLISTCSSRASRRRASSPIGRPRAWSSSSIPTPCGRTT